MDNKFYKEFEKEVKERIEALEKATDQLSLENIYLDAKMNKIIKTTKLKEKKK